jgi:hypothetical protein
VEEKKLQCNDIAISALHEALDDKTFEQVKNIEIAHDAWAKLEETYKGTKGTKTAKAYILQEKFSSFKMQEDESVSEMFHRLKVIVNELKALGEEVKENQFSMKFLRSLLKRFDMLITVLVRTTLKDSTPQQVFQEVMTDDSYREDDEKEEFVKKKKKESEKKNDEKKKKKSVAFKATTSKGKSKIESSSDEDSSSCDSDDIDEKMTLFVKQFGKFMKKKCFRVRRRKNSSKKNEHTMRCFRCHNKDHLIAKCPYDSDDEDAIKKKRKKQKKSQEKESSHKKKNDSHVAIWDSDDSSSDDEDDNKSKKGHASIAIQEKVSLFDTPSCFMAKAAKVSSDDESDHNSASDSDSDDDDLIKDELITMLEDCTQYFKESRKECKGLLKLQKSHTKLEEAYSSLVKKCENMPTNVEKAKTCNIGISCDIIDESLYKPIVVTSTNPSCSISTSSSSSSDGLTCDSTRIVENENLKKEVKELNHTLAKAYGGEDRLLMCLGSQRASLYKE